MILPKDNMRLPNDRNRWAGVRFYVLVAVVWVGASLVLRLFHLR
jgi:hypothetical protein